MNVSRYLFALPVAFAATLAAAACSSSSSSPATGGDGGGGNADCEALAVCCASSSYTGSVSQCEAAVSAGGASCSTNLATLTAANQCGGTSAGSTSSTSTIGTSSSSSTSTSSAGSSGSSGNDGGTPVGCNPQPITGTTITAKPPPAAACSGTQNSEVVNDCFFGSTDASVGVCDTALGVTDAGLGTCGQCVLTGEAGPNWGAFVVIEPPVSAGATTGTELDLFNIAGCVGRVDTTSAGQACASALEQLNACEFAACVPYCPVASQMDTAGQDALFGTSTQMGCLGNADSAVCSTYVTAVNTSCAAETNDAGTGAYDKCSALLTAAQAATASSPTGLADYVGVMCGGADAGI